MILISHRGNINGPKKELENNPIYIQNAMDLGYQVEIDIWKIESDFFLGHEAPEFQVSEEWIKEKSKYFIDEYSKCLVNGKNVNGELTLGENLADHGGVKIAYYALKKKLDTEKIAIETTIDKNNFNIFKRFFISWALVWRCNITDQETDKRLLTDPHSPNDLRINCTLSNIPEFHKEFDIKEGDKMFRHLPTQMW